MQTQAAKPKICKSSIPKTLSKRLYLGDVALQLVVLFDVEACPFHPLVKEQQILSVSGIGVNVLLRDRQRQKDRQTRPFIKYHLITPLANIK